MRWQCRCGQSLYQGEYQAGVCRACLFSARSRWSWLMRLGEVGRHWR